MFIKSEFKLKGTCVYPFAEFVAKRIALNRSCYFSSYSVLRLRETRLRDKPLKIFGWPAI